MRRAVNLYNTYEDADGPYHAPRRPRTAAAGTYNIVTKMMFTVYKGRQIDDGTAQTPYLPHTACGCQ